MNINNWPDNKIMALPDWAFGQRYPVNVGYYADQGGIFYAISDSALPDNCVVWLVSVDWCRVAGNIITISLKMGDVLPTTDAEFVANGEFIRELGTQTTGFKQISMEDKTEIKQWPMKKLIYPQGRRLIMRARFLATATGYAQAVVIISSLPTEAPDWLI